MAWVESAVVHYLRTTIDRVQPYQPNPLPAAFNYGQIEWVREAATLLMLLLVGWLAGKSIRTRFGYSMLAFGIWDIGYYAFLHVMSGWPASLSDWDILFLIPLPWWGPVWAPVAISLLMIGAGTALSQLTQRVEMRRAQWVTWSVAGLGALVAMYTFMAGPIELLPANQAAIQAFLPSAFQWPLFVMALAMMSIPMTSMVLQAGRSRIERKRSVV